MSPAMALRVPSAVFATPGGLAPANCMPNEHFTAFLFPLDYSTFRESPNVQA